MGYGARSHHSEETHLKDFMASAEPKQASALKMAAFSGREVRRAFFGYFRQPPGRKPDKRLGWQIKLIWHTGQTHTHIHIVVMTNKDVSIYSGQVQWPVTQGFIHVISLSHCPGNRRVRFARTCWMSMMLWASRGVGKHSGLLCKMWKTRCQRIWSFQSTKTGKPCISCAVERNESSLKIPSWNRRSSVRRTPAFLTWQMERHRLAVFVSFRWLMMLKALRIRMRWVTIRFIQPQLVCPVQVWCSTNVEFVK